MLSNPGFVETEKISRLNETDVILESPGRIEVRGVNRRYEDSQSQDSITEHATAPFVAMRERG